MGLHPKELRWKMRFHGTDFPRKGAFTWQHRASACAENHRAGI